MNRADVRTLKKQIRARSSPEGVRQAQQAAIALLERSMRFGHRRLALRRFLEAESLDAPLTDHHKRYVRELACRQADQARERK